ncbi:MAG: TonB-dependent receptor [Acidobacteria bacterium]|nr:TonB-dependent receptor [Acidobacteriota bacterium]
MFAQTTVTGAITGIVSDASGAAVANATVEATNTSTGVTDTTQTNSTGLYRFPSLVPGPYSVKITQTNFAPFEQKNITLNVGVTVRVDAALSVGTVNSAVMVTSDAPLLQTDSVDVSQTLQTSAVNSLPTFGRNVTRLNLLSPGVSMPSGQLEVHPENAGQDFDVNINGASPNNNSHLLDGVDNTEGIQGFSMLVTSQDSVQEVKVTTTNYDAEYGRVGGGVFQVTTKSGTNNLHGSLFEYYRSAGFNAANPFSEPNGPPGNVWNQFGGSLGGPIKKNKLFFFGDYQGMRNRLATSSLYTAPLAAFRNGDFSSLAETNPIYDPLTGNPDGTGRTQFAGNIIPSDRISPAAANLLALLPNPTNPGATDNNFTISRPGVYNTDQFNTRVDLFATNKTTIFGKYSYFRSKFFTDNVFGADGGGPALGGIPNSGDSKTHTHSAMMDYQHTFTPHLLHDFRFAISRLFIQELQLDANRNAADDVGIPDINLGTIFTTGLPQFNINGPVGSFSMGDFGLPFFEKETIVQFADNWSYTHGRHAIKWGADITKFFGVRTDTSGRGTFDFSQNTTGDAEVAGSGLGMASFLLGMPIDYSRRVTLVQPQEKQWRLAFYGQDTWQIAPKLTLMLGLRWDWASPIFTPKGQSVGNLDVATGNILLTNLYDKYAGVKTLKNEFSPRIGLSYQLAQNTVIRAGFGRSYFLNPYGAAFGTQGCCWPIKQDQTLNSENFYTPLDFTLDQGPGVPDTPPAFPSSGQVPLPDGYTQIFPGVGKYPHSYSDAWNLTVQHSFGHQISTSVAYVGNVGRKLWNNIDLNTPVPGPGDFNPRRPFYEEFGWTQTILLRNNTLSSNYHSLQVHGEKRFGGGLFVLSNFTWSKSLDYGTFGVQNIFDVASNYGPSSFTRPRAWITAFNWEVPFGNKLTGAAKTIAAGWGLSGVVNLESGSYFTPTWGDTSHYGSPITLRPDRNGSGRVSNPNRNLWFDPTVFSQPADFTYGNSGKGILMGPGFATTDLSVTKGFSIRESMKLQLRWDAYNLFNRTNLSNPAATVDQPSTAGKIFGIVDYMRRMQIGAHLTF